MMLARSSYRIVAIGLLGALAAVCIWIVRGYLSDISSARTRIASGSRVIATRCGNIEYADGGSGPALLMIHGAGGGFDQGMALAESFVSRGYRVIAMSRFGYLRTPAPESASNVAQANAHACLLDALGVGSAAVVGVSAGAPSALEFALRYPGRCAALVLLVPGWFPAPGGAPRRFGPLTGRLFDWVLHSDFAYWATSRFLRTAAYRAVLGTPPGVIASASAPEQARVEAMLWNILPISQRSVGLLLEARLTVQPLSESLNAMTAPTLIITAKDDLYGTDANAQFIARGIPHAELIEYPVGGHLLVGHSDEVRAAIARFLHDKITDAPGQG